MFKISIVEEGQRRLVLEGKLVPPHGPRRWRARGERAGENCWAESVIDHKRRMVVQPGRRNYTLI